MRIDAGANARCMQLLGVFGLLWSVQACDGASEPVPLSPDESPASATEGPGGMDPSMALAGPDAGGASDPAEPEGEGSGPWDGGRPAEGEGGDVPPAPMGAMPASESTAEPDGGLAVTDGGVLDPMGVPSLAALVTDVFMPGCLFGRCHVTAAPAAGLSFTGLRVSVHSALVEAPSQTAPGRVRVVPYEPDTSYLMEKLTAEQPAAGEPMPPMGRLAPEYIERIRQWIAAGAPDN